MELDSEDEEIWNNKGNTFFKLENYEKALECYDRALEINTNFELAKLGKKDTEDQLNSFSYILSNFFKKFFGSN
ncbi:TPR repeat-containing protein [Methanococcus maripaludis C5]|uniref:TPR repeat-containing protein n=1 Tax=Methanococcus maripaludis (strain C5 / ATCC BAA-1333) TaxID=402880 RepID=A4FXQ1_METM5|nr:tetratricopeptide repeat protein [Methanococcus maripaludis]ABO34985.1 TPR repeat-containing protein [Methanococcus maripaludis C5]